MDRVKPIDALLFPGNSDMAQRMREFDWPSTPLGPVEQWPQSLKIAVRIMLTSRQPFWIGWGEQLTYLYNDPYKAIIGGKHPAALGQPTRVVWRELWDDIGPMLATAMAGQEGTYVEAQLLIMERHGYPEETYYTFSYTPIPAEDGGAGGILCANTDDTQRVIGERQLALLRELATNSSDARTVAAACALSAASLQTNAHDLPFALIYLAEPNRGCVVLAGTSGIPVGHALVPETAALDDSSLWPLAEVLQTRQVRLVANLGAYTSDLPAGAWKQPPHQAAVVPIAPLGSMGKAGILIAGLNPFRLFDDNYRRFLDLVSSQIAAGIANAQAYEEERRRAEALAELDRAKTLFFTNISHEFRTPLTLMLAPLEDMLAKPEGGVLPDNRELVQIVHRHSLRLLKLVNALLDFSRIEAGRMKAAYASTDVAALTSELASMFRSAIEKAGMALVVDCPPIDAPVYLDREMWEKIVLNLLSNAFKFTFEGQIEVRLRQVGEVVELIVRDSGVGIPAKDLPHVFERFHRVEEAKRRSHEGTGIGLALVHELTKLHGGSVRVDSIEGQGTTFTVSIPTGAAHLPSDRIEGTRSVSSTSLAPDLYVEEALQWLPLETDEENSFSRDPKGSANALPFGPRLNEFSSSVGDRPRIVLADDNADMREYVRRLLSQRYHVQAVADGAAALEAVRLWPPDLVISDVMMPRLDGFGLLRELRADIKTRTIPVMLLSARAGEEACVEGLSQGADDYLIKPFRARELLARVDSRLGLARLQRETEGRITTVLESITDGFLTLDRDWRFVYVNAEAERLNGMNRHAMLGKTQWEIFPATLGTIVEQEFRRAVAEQVQVDFENYYQPWQRWFAVRAYPMQDGGLSVFFQDVTERKQAEGKLRESEGQFRQLADSLSPIVWTARADGQIDFFNRRWTEFTGFPQTAGNDAWGQILHPDDLPPASERWAASLKSGADFEMEMRLLDRRQQTYRWHLVRTVAVRDEAGRVAHWFGTSTDIHEQKRAEESARYLAEASAVLASVVDYESTLQRIASLAVPYFADWSAVDMADDRGSLRRLAVAHQDPDKIALVHQLAHEYPPDPEAPLGAFAVLRTGKPEIMSDIPDELLVQGAKDERHLRLLRSLGLKSYICVPLKVTGKVLGVLSFVTAESGRRFTESDLALAMDLANRAAAAIENSQLYQALRETNRRKDEFLATLAHELRNPLAPIRNAVHIMRLAGSNGEITEQARQTIERQMNQMVRLVDDLLDVSRISTNKIELRKERVALSSVVQSAIETSGPLMEASGHELSVTLPPQTVWLNADLTRMAQVVANLLNNAAKYTPQRGRIWLSAELTSRECERPEAIIRVRDSGIGIPQEMLPRIFEMFTQVDTSLDRAQGGLGIGLTLVKSLVEMHGGSIEAASAGPNQGSEFTVRLPVVADEKSAQWAVRDAEGGPSMGLPMRRILVVDDNRDAAESMGLLLRMLGNDVRVVHDGQAALELVGDFRPDLALLDIGMPRMSGFELAKRIREQPALRKMVLIAVTGWGQAEDRRRSQEAGFDHHLTKPADLAVLEKLLGSLHSEKG